MRTRFLRRTATATFVSGLVIGLAYPGMTGWRFPIALGFLAGAQWAWAGIRERRRQQWALRRAWTRRR